MQYIPFNDLKLDDYFDKVFYINLAKDTERNKNIVDQFRLAGISNYERIEAIQLTSLPEIGLYRNFIKKEPKYILGSLSCRASHIKCIQTAKDRNYQRILILEDDIVFLSNPNNLLLQNQQSLGEWDMLYFGGLIEPHFRNQVVCAHAYAVNSSLFDDIINMGNCSGMEIDNFYAKILQHMSYNYNASGKYNIKAIIPFNQIVQNKSLASNIQNG